MNWYPWLNHAYKQIISFYQARRGHHALLLHSNIGMGGNALIYAISRWLMCQYPIGIKSCGKCHSCKLMLAYTHPDWHKVIVEIGKSQIGVENIRYLTEALVTHSQQGGAKVVWFSCIETLTEAASNVLLKVLEEPTSNTYFLLECHNSFQLLDTLRSRCFYYHLSIPDVKIVIDWIQKQKLPLLLSDIDIAIKLNESAPLDALSLLQPENWFKRKRFCRLLMQNLTANTLLDWLPELNQPDVIKRIKWLVTLLIDAVKSQQHITDYCINQDQLLLIAKLTTTNSANFLLKNAIEWQRCSYRLMSVIGLNQELQLISQLINWQNNFYQNN